MGVYDMDFQKELQERVAYTEKVIGTYLPKEEGFQKSLLEAMNYSFLAGGKRLRPLLMLECYRMFGGSGQIVEPFMAAQEMIHTYSLVSAGNGQRSVPEGEKDDPRRLRGSHGDPGRGRAAELCF